MELFRILYFFFQIKDKNRGDRIREGYIYENLFNK